ncbi:wax ester/triacylglycerol synthase domain-containing protein [Micromonospora sp. WMMD736]|uniref:wax ester/triacylglycerol synthase domain-containing protein n=1 Tax=Micromonospora sp. WMMD736 TaxID=3404112 RepID=UPI003B9457A8
MSHPTNEEGWAALAQWGTDARMNDLEALMWRGERHPEFSSTGVVLELMDSPPDWERFRNAHVWGASMVRRLRQRVVEPALPLGPPAWADDPDFDLDYHLRRLRLPEPAGTRELLDLAQVIGETPLDRTRPLWTGTLVENLAGGRSAYLLQAHHCLMDGAAAIQLFAGLHSNRPEPSSDKPVAELAVPERVDPLALTAADLISGVRSLPGHGRHVLGAIGSALASPGRTVQYLDSARRVLSPPVGTSPSPLQVRQTGRTWRFGILECGLDELKAAAHTVGGTVNDAYVAALLGGIGRYHDVKGIDLGDIPTAMPLSVRKPDDPPGGNRFAGAMFAGPAGIREPVARMQAVMARVRKVRGEPALDVMGGLSGVLSRIPSPLLSAVRQAAMPRPVLSASNFPGLTEHVYAAGARVEGMYVLAPLPSVSMLAALCSYAGRCCVGMNCDGAVFEDPELLWSCITEGLDEVLDLGRNGGHGRR